MSIPTPIPKYSLGDKMILDQQESGGINCIVTAIQIADNDPQYRISWFDQWGQHELWVSSWRLTPRK